MPESLFKRGPQDFTALLLPTHDTSLLNLSKESYNIGDRL